MKRRAPEPKGERTPPGALRPAPRWRRRPELRPRQILAAAAKVFPRKGLHGATLESVARQAGITKGTIYLYYRNKEDLFIAMLRERSDRVLRGLQAAAPGGTTGSFPDRIVRFVQEAYRTMTRPETLATIRMVLAEAERFPETARLFFKEIILKNNRLLQAALDGAISTGEVRSIDSLVAARCLMGMLIVFALTQELLGGKKVLPLARERILDTATSVFLDGVLREGRAAPAGPRGRRKP